MDKLDCGTLEILYVPINKYDVMLMFKKKNGIVFHTYSHIIFCFKCFLNAIVQCLSHTRSLRDYCLMKAFLQDKHSNQEPVLMNGRNTSAVI